MHSKDPDANGALKLVAAAAAFVVAAFVVLVVAGIMSAKGADAADKGGPSFLPVPGASVAAAPWTGFHIYGGAGYGWQETEVSGSGKLNGSTFDLDNGLATAGIGYNIQIGNIVLGPMADASFGNLKAAYESKSVYDADWQWFVGGRVGLLPAPKILVYGLVGFTKMEGGSFDFSALKDGPNRKLSDIEGFTWGLGAEAMLDEKWTVRLEYRRVNGGDGAVNIPLDDTPALQELQTDIHQGRIVVSYKLQ
jgi:opacity protein-like surface antigen